jgi:hypothetical protein
MASTGALRGGLVFFLWTIFGAIEPSPALAAFENDGGYATADRWIAGPISDGGCVRHVASRRSVWDGGIISNLREHFRSSFCLIPIAEFICNIVVSGRIGGTDHGVYEWGGLSRWIDCERLNEGLVSNPASFNQNASVCADADKKSIQHSATDREHSIVDRVSVEDVDYVESPTVGHFCDLCSSGSEFLKRIFRDFDSVKECAATFARYRNVTPIEEERIGGKRDYFARVVVNDRPAHDAAINRNDGVLGRSSSDVISAVADGLSDSRMNEICYKDQEFYDKIRFESVVLLSPHWDFVEVDEMVFHHRNDLWCGDLDE